MTPKEFAKKIIASINPGTADISGIGDGTIKGAISEQNKKLSVCPQETFSNWGSLLNSLNQGITIFRPSDLKSLSPIQGTMDDWGTVTIIKAGHQHEASIIWHSVNVSNNYTREVYIGMFDGAQVSWDKL